MNKKRGIIYCRVSTVGQAEDGVSLDNQLDKCKKFLELNDYEVVKVFREEGQSGRTEWRDEFQSMMSYIREHRNEIDGICFYALSRLGRNVQMVLNTISELDDYQVSVLSVNEKLDTSNYMGRFVLTILSALSQLESEQISDRVFDNMHFSVKNYGTWQGSRFYPYGYRPQKEKDEHGNRPLKIIPEQAKQIKKIFEYYVEGLDGDTDVGTFKIAKKLNELGYKYLREGTKNTEWTNKRVLDIVKNAHFYAGWYYWNRTGTRDKVVYEETEHGLISKKPVMSKRSKSLKPVRETYIKPKSEWAIGKGQHEPIISESVWKVAEAKYESRRNTNKNLDTTRQPKHYLTGCLVCPDCSGRMLASTSRRKTKKGEVLDIYYRCQRASAGENCNHNVIKEDYILPVVKQAFFAYYPYLIKSKINKNIIAQLHLSNTVKSKSYNEIVALEEEIQDYLRKIESAFESFQEGLLLKENYLRMKNKNEVEIKKLQSQIDKIKDKDKEMLVSSKDAETLKEIINNYADAEDYFNSLDKLTQREVLQEVVKRVEVEKIPGLKGKKSVRIKRLVINDKISYLLDEDLQEVWKEPELADAFLQLNAEIMNNAKMKDFTVVGLARPTKKILELESEYSVIFWNEETDLYNINISTFHKINQMDRNDEDFYEQVSLLIKEQNIDGELDHLFETIKEQEV